MGERPGLDLSPLPGLLYNVPIVSPSSPSLAQPTLAVRLTSLLFSYAHLSSLLSVSSVVKPLGPIHSIQRRALARHGPLLAATPLRRGQEEAATKVIIPPPMSLQIESSLTVEAPIAGAVWITIADATQVAPSNLLAHVRRACRHFNTHGEDPLKLKQASVHIMLTTKHSGAQAFD